MTEASNWAELVANRHCKFYDVPEEFKIEVKRLLDKLLDPNEPVPPIVYRNYVWRDGQMVEETFDDT